MSYLINRTPPARFRCLYYLLQFAYSKFGEREFTMGELLFNKNEKNIHNFCELLKFNKNLNIEFCPYLQNPLSDAGCYLTKGIDDDTTKRKEISNSVNCLDALGFIDREGRILKITGSGKLFAKTNFNSKKWLEIIRTAICNYGVSVGLLFQLEQQNEGLIDTRELFIGYPNTNETIKIDGRTIEISSGSQRDSNARTKSCLLAWFTTAGFISPNCISDNTKIEQAHIDTNEYIISKSTRSERMYKKKFIPKIFSSNFEVKKPLNYNNLIKDITALRENGQKISREATMKYAHIIKNRRFAILYCLDFAFRNNKLLDFEMLKTELLNHKKFFVINISNFRKIMDTELLIALTCGIPFELRGKYLFKPLTCLNLDILCYEAPQDLINVLNRKILKKIYEMSV